MLLKNLISEFDVEAFDLFGMVPLRWLYDVASVTWLCSILTLTHSFIPHQKRDV